MAAISPMDMSHLTGLHAAQASKFLRMCQEQYFCTLIQSTQSGQTVMQVWNAFLEKLQKEAKAEENGMLQTAQQEIIRELRKNWGSNPSTSIANENEKRAQAKRELLPVGKTTVRPKIEQRMDWLKRYLSGCMCKAFDFRTDVSHPEWAFGFDSWPDTATKSCDFLANMQKANKLTDEQMKEISKTPFPVAGPANTAASAASDPVSELGTQLSKLNIKKEAEAAAKK